MPYTHCFKAKWEGRNDRNEIGRMERRKNGSKRWKEIRKNERKEGSKERNKDGKTKIKEEERKER